MMKMVNRILLVLFGSASGLYAQSVLTIDDAIKTGLEKNYSVLIVKNQQEIAKAQNNFGNAGMSPTVTLNAGLNAANLNSHQEFNTGVVQDKPGAASNNLAASVNVNWTVFDGLRMFAIKKRLSLNEDLSAIQLKQQMENTVYDIIAAYYDIARINELIKAAKQNLSIYEEREKIAKLKLEIGSDSKVDLLLTQSDANKAKSSILQLELQMLNAKARLNLLVNKSADTEFTTSDSIIVNYDPQIDELKKNVLKSNSTFLISKQNELISAQSIKEARAVNMPFIQLNGAYNFTRAQSQAGIVFLNQQSGLNGGITASWLLFNGTKNSKLVKERNLLFLNQKYYTEQIQLEIDALVYTSYKSFVLNKQIVDLERRNLADAQDVLTISLERYKIGKSNLLETIETQKNLEDAQTRYIQALYNIKLAEAELLRTNGTLVK